MSKIPPGTDIEGRVRVLRNLDAGGQAEIYLVDEIGTGRRLVAKLVVFDFENRSSLEFKIRQEGLDRELDILGDLSHRFIGKFLYQLNDVLEIDGAKQIVRGFAMEHSPIGTLARHLISDDGISATEISISERLKICCQIVEAIVEIHSFGITHSDIKAENVLLTMQTKRLVPILIDFGSAFRAHESWPGFGSDPYLAPEIRSRKASASTRTDIYSLGVLLSEVLSGERLFQPNEIKIDSLTLPSVFEDLRRRLKRMVANDPEYRPRAAEILASLEDKRARSNSTIIFDRNKLSFPYGAFDWKDQIHQQLLQCSRVLILLKGNRPTIESDALERKLAEIGIFGGRIRRLIGDYDFLVDVWVREKTRELLEDVCQNFNLMTTHSSVEPRYYDIGDILDARSNQPPEELSEKNEGELLKNIFEIISKETLSDSVQKFKDRGYGSPFSNNENAIEFIVQFETKSKLLPGAIVHYQKAVFEYGHRKIVELGEADLLSRFSVLTLKDSSDFLVVFSVRKFVNFSHIMLGIMRELREKRVHQDHTFSVKTLVDFDGQPRKEGRDGIIPMLLMETYL
jgi:tRNA A-37 threonylcarbamoyl transferase component Bud32